MKTCKGCKYAEWDLNKAGKLHPSGNGKCTYKVKIPVLPLSMYWGLNTKPYINGGSINRKEPHQEHCPCYQHL